ncbi:MAG TPA: subclass B3 metallo-beta-lactamase [Ohtaekwangia sp.]
MIRSNVFLLLNLIIASFTTIAQTRTYTYYDSAWSRPYAPFQVAGNVYYVGTYDLACYLIVTPDGHALINTGLEESVSLIQKNIETLGFNFKDIKILLTTQGHFDHVAGMAEIKSRTNAKMYVHEQDVQVLEDGGNSDFALKGLPGITFNPVKVDRALKDGEVIALGGTNIKVLHHPGHTKGATSFLINVRDENRSWNLLIANIPSVLSQVRISGMPSYPNVGKDFARTFDAMKAVSFDIWVASHASQFNLHDKRKPGDSYNPGIFSDRERYEASINSMKQEYDRKLKSELSGTK